MKTTVVFVILATFSLTLGYVPYAWLLLMATIDNLFDAFTPVAFILFLCVDLVVLLLGGVLLVEKFRMRSWVSVVLIAIVQVLVLLEMSTTIDFARNGLEMLTR